MTIISRSKEICSLTTWGCFHEVVGNEIFVQESCFLNNSGPNTKSIHEQKKRKSVSSCSEVTIFQLRKEKHFQLWQKLAAFGLWQNFTFRVAHLPWTLKGCAPWQWNLYELMTMYASGCQQPKLHDHPAVSFQGSSDNHHGVNVRRNHRSHYQVGSA